MSEHTLHITKIADDTSDRVEWTITCPTVSRSCEIFFTCEVDGCTIPSPWDWEDDDPEAGMDIVSRHGAEHQHIDGDWMVPSGWCATLHADLSDDICDIARARGIGDWPVEIDYEGDGMWRLNAIPETNEDA
jgi:hypothetical protein